MSLTKNNPTPKSQALSLFFAGLLPVIAFTIIEEKYGTWAGLIAGMVFGLGEIIFELIKYKKVNNLTWIGNGMLLLLGGISLVFNDGLWFKLQPALFEFGFFIFLMGSWILKKPFLRLMIEKQNPDAPEIVKNLMNQMTFRLSLFFLFHALLATWAALHWTSEAWALLKGIGLTISLIIYMICEVIWLKIKKPQK